MANPLRKLDRTLRDARRFAADARVLAAARRSPLDPAVRGAIAAACDEVDAAADEGDPLRLSRALRALDGLWSEHLDRVGKPAWREYAEVAVAVVVAVTLLRLLVVEGYRIRSGSMAPTLLPGDHVLVSRIAYGVPVPFTRARLWGVRPRRGDVIVVESPRSGADVVQRVVGLPGDVVELRDGVLFLNGVPQPRSYDGEIPYEQTGEAGAGAFRGTCRRFREALARGDMGFGSASDPAQVEARWQAAAAAGVANHAVLDCPPGRLVTHEGPFVVAPGQLFAIGDQRSRSADAPAAGFQVPFDRVKGRVARVSFSWGAGGAVFGRGPRLGRLLQRVE